MSLQNDDLFLVNRGGESFKTEYGLLKNSINEDGGVVIGDNPPSDPHDGDLWYNSDDGRLYVWYVNETTGVVTDVSVRNGGSGYNTSGTDVSTDGGSGSELTIDYQAGVGGALSNPTVNQGGHAYEVNDVVFVTGSGHANSTVNVTAVNSVAVGQWVDASPDGGGDGIYLSKLNDDTAAGEITFKGLTTHEAGVEVTGGDGSNFDKGLYSPTSDPGRIVLKSGNSELKVTENSNIAFRFESGGNADGPVVSTGLSSKFTTSGDFTVPVTAISANFGKQGFTSTGDISGYEVEISTSTGISTSEVIAGYKSDISTGANLGSGNVYNFYAPGGAPNYFRGNVIIASPTDSSTYQSAPNGGLVYKTTSNQPSNARFECVGGWRSDATSWNIACLFSGETSATDSTPVTRGDIRIKNTNIVITGTNGAPFLSDGAADSRLITSTEAIVNASDVVKQLQPVKINGIRHGFVADALEPLVAEAVSGNAGATEAVGTLSDYDGTEIETEVTEPSAEELTYTEEVESEGVTTQTVRTRTWTATGTQPVYQGADQTKLIPLLTKALQEALARIEALEADHATLMNNGGY